MTRALLLPLSAIVILAVSFWFASQASRASKLAFLGRVLLVVVLAPSLFYACSSVFSKGCNGDSSATRQRLLREALEREARERKARAEIDATLQEVARLVSQNDFDAALEFVSHRASQTRGYVVENRRSVKVVEATATALVFERLELDVEPARAFVSFHASLRGAASVWPFPQRFPFVVECDVSRLELQREEDGVWRVQDNYTLVHKRPESTSTGERDHDGEDAFEQEQDAQPGPVPNLIPDPFQ